MSRLAARMSKTLEHTLDKEMSEILAQITGNVHEQLQVTDGQGIVLAEQLQKRTPEAYSQGTMQQAYFSYRMAAVYADEGRTAAISFGRDLCKL